MKTQNEIKSELEQLQDQLRDDEAMSPESRLPCCDYRELETRIDVLQWMLTEDKLTASEDSKRFFDSVAFCNVVDLTEAEIAIFVKEENNVEYDSGLRSISGGFACITVNDVDEEDENILLCQIKSGVQSDCQNDVQTDYFTYNRETKELNYA